jgi:hypothetical protein
MTLNLKNNGLLFFHSSTSVADSQQPLNLKKALFKCAGELESLLTLFKSNSNQTTAKLNYFSRSERFVLHGHSDRYAGGVHCWFYLFLYRFWRDGGLYSKAGRDKIGHGRHDWGLMRTLGIVNRLFCLEYVGFFLFFTIGNSENWYIWHIDNIISYCFHCGLLVVK